MNQIKFSHRYPKFGDATSAKLYDIEKVHIKNLDKDFLEYDTKYINPDGSTGYYDLSKHGVVIILKFTSNKGQPFATIRRWTPQKEEYYRSKIGQIFEIVITENEK